MFFLAIARTKYNNLKTAYQLDELAYKQRYRDVCCTIVVNVGRPSVNQRVDVSLEQMRVQPIFIFNAIRCKLQTTLTKTHFYA